MEKRFNLTVRTEPGYAVLQTEGYLNEGVGQHLAETAKSLLRNGYNPILINFEKIGMINSYGIGALLDMDGFLKEQGGVLFLCHLSATMERVFKLMGLSPQMAIFPDEEKAVANFRDYRYNSIQNVGWFIRCGHDGGGIIDTVRKEG